MAEKDPFAKTLSLMAILEAALFLSPEPLPLSKLSKLCEATEKAVKESLHRLKVEMEGEKRGLLLLETEQGYQLGTKPELAAFMERLFVEEYPQAPLSRAALETLAIIALKQPVTRLEIENIRGVNADGVIDNLLKRGLIRVAGRKETLGRPIIYATTDDFLQYFGLTDLAEMEELKNFNPDSDVFPQVGETI